MDETNIAADKTCYLSLVLQDLWNDQGIGASKTIKARDALTDTYPKRNRIYDRNVTLRHIKLSACKYGGVHI